MDILVDGSSSARKKYVIHKLVSFFSVFGVYYSDFGSTFQSDRCIFIPNVKSKVHF